MKYINVVIDHTSRHTDTYYTYAAPDDITVGDIVEVSFNRGNKPKKAYVFEESVTPDCEVSKIKAITGKNSDISLNPEMVKTCIWMKKRYGIKYLDAVKCFVQNGNPAKEGKEKEPYKDAEGEKQDIRNLTEEQQIAVDTISCAVRGGRQESFLIHGVTGSGKTEVYMQVIAEVLAASKTDIMLVPEIALTAQLIERMERIVYSAPEEPDGHICQKGCLAGRQPYDPKRLKAPLKRVGERGSGKFEEISWDQALDEICEKLCLILDEHCPDSVVLWNLGAGVPEQYSFENLMPFRFANTFGVTVPLGSIGLDNGPFYAEFYNAGSEFPRTVIDPRIMVGTDLIYVWGCNPIENQMRCAQNLVRAREAGARIVDLGLIFDGTAGFADEFVAMKPASDGYLAMAMVNYILQNDLQASDYLLARTIAAYLVDDETGQLARDAEGNFLVWDNATGAPAAVAAKKGDYPEGADIPLFGTFQFDGRSYTTALQKLKDGAAEYTFELAAEKCGISAADAERLARDWVEAENAFIL